jgi:DNA-binding HxlR family transcriptional regulator
VGISDLYEERPACPLYTAIAVIDGRWKPMILQRLGPGPIGFGMLRRALPGITTKVLREQLRQLMADDLVSRDPRDAASGVVRYRVTAHGRSLGPVFESLCLWGTRHLQHPRAAAGTRAVPPGRRAAQRAVGT